MHETSDDFVGTFRMNRAHSAGGPGVGEGPQEQSGQDKQVCRASSSFFFLAHRELSRRAAPYVR